MRLSKIIMLLLVQAVAITIATAQSHISDTLQIYFKTGKTDVVPSFKDNGNTLESLYRFLEESNDTHFNYRLKGITLQGSASPEGKQHWNAILARRRADAVAGYIEKQFPAYRRFVQKDNIKLNLGAHTTLWPELRSTKIVVDYFRFFKGPELPQISRPKIPSAETSVANARVIGRKAAYPTPEARITADVKQTENTLSEDSSSKNFRIAIKTNALYDLMITPNLGVEIPVSNKWSIAGNWMYAWWKSDPKKWYHRIYGGDIEARRWLKPTTTLSGLHFGAYGQILTYDFEWGGKGVLGGKWTWGAGISLGYAMHLAQRFNLDFNVGAGYLTGEYIVYKPIGNCYVWQATKNRRWFGPTKAEISLVWLLGRW